MRPLLIGAAMSAGTLTAAILLGACTEDASEASDPGRDAEAQADGAEGAPPDSGAILAEASTSHDANEPVSTDVAPMDAGSDTGSDAAIDASAPAYKIGGILSGLAPGASIVLHNVGGDALTLTTNGTFSFSAPLVTGAAYDVTVQTNPSSPSQTQTCTVAAGSGNVGGADITSVVVTCTNNAYAIGGTLTGLAPGKSVSLENQDGSPLTLTTNGAFAFGPRQTQGTIFLIKVSSPPVGETCTVTGGSGTVGAADVTSATVTCTPLAYAVGGTVSGNLGPVELANAGQSLSTTGPKFAFPSQEHGSSYGVTVTSSPLGQTCTVANGGGTVEGPIANVLVSCVNDLPPADLYVDASDLRRCLPPPRDRGPHLRIQLRRPEPAACVRGPVRCWGHRLAQHVQRGLRRRQHDHAGITAHRAQHIPYELPRSLRLRLILDPGERLPGDDGWGREHQRDFGVPHQGQHDRGQRDGRRHDPGRLEPHRQQHVHARRWLPWRSHRRLLRRDPHPP